MLYRNLLLYHFIVFLIYVIIIISSSSSRIKTFYYLLLLQMKNILTFPKLHMYNIDIKCVCVCVWTSKYYYRILLLDSDLINIYFCISPVVYLDLFYLLDYV